MDSLFVSLLAQVPLLFSILIKAAKETLGRNSPGVTPLTGVLFPSLQIREILLPFLRLLPYPPVKNDHHSDGHVKRSDRCTKRDVMIRLDELNVAGVNGHRSGALDVRPGINPRWP